jgi:gliding motility-associated-like protein
VNLSLTDTTVCPDQPVSVELLNADDFDEIMWSPEEGISCTDCPNPTIRTPETRTYTVTGESMGCPASGSVQIQIFPPDLININPDTIVCPGEPIRLVAEEAAAYEQLTWMGNGLQCMDCESPVAIVDRPTNYQVTGVKPDGCLGFGGININTFTLPSVTVGSEPLGPVEVGTTVVFTATTNPDITTSGTFTWFVNGNQIAAMNAAIEASVPSEGENEIKVEVITPEGCMVMGNLNIEGTPPRFDIPSAFSPTGDELNDRFKVLIFGNIRLAEFKVFNRWGQLVYDGLDEEGWDGRHNGKEAPADVYAYSAILELPDGSLRSVRGEVTLIR